MPHDAMRVADTEAWLGKARSDLRSAEVGLSADPPLTEDALFHCQQAVEKSLKAFLTWHDQRFRKTHSIDEIGEAAIVIDSTLTEFVDRAAPLSEYAWKFRYPGEAEEPAPDEAHEALTLAREVHQAILSRLPEGVGS